MAYLNPSVSSSTARVTGPFSPFISGQTGLPPSETKASFRRKSRESKSKVLSQNAMVDHRCHWHRPNGHFARVCSCHQQPTRLERTGPNGNAKEKPSAKGTAPVNASPNHCDANKTASTSFVPIWFDRFHRRAQATPRDEALCKTVPIQPSRSRYSKWAVKYCAAEGTRTTWAADRGSSG